MNEKIPSKYAILLTSQSRRAVTRDAIVTANGDIRKYDKLCASYDKEFEPVGKLQERLVHELVDLRWRLEHLRTYAERCRNPKGAPARPSIKALKELGLYERRVLKQYEEIFSDLCRYQNKPRPC